MADEVDELVALDSIFQVEVNQDDLEGNCGLGSIGNVALKL
jgi:hypothetical protein